MVDDPDSGPRDRCRDRLLVDIAGERRAPGRTWSLAAARRYALLSLVLLLVLARGYLGPIVNGWSYPRGVDRYEHAVMAGMMMREGRTSRSCSTRRASTSLPP